jgi:uncharacterized protein (UPF0548 family)
MRILVSSRMLGNGPQVVAEAAQQLVMTRPHTEAGIKPCTFARSSTPSAPARAEVVRPELVRTCPTLGDIAQAGRGCLVVSVRLRTLVNSVIWIALSRRDSFVTTRLQE